MVNWKQIGAIAAGVLVVGAGTAGVVNVNNNVNDNAADLEDIKISLKEDEVVITPEVVPTQLDEVQSEVDLIKLKLFEDDAFEAVAEVLALEEIEDDDYEALYDFMTDADELNLSISDERDIDEVVIEDVTVTGADIDDEDANVVHELKVYYENSDGDNKKCYLKVTTHIRDGDVDIEEIEEN